jgi:predicted ribosomally synthesized peptide with SipW-like signal peptide
MSKKYKLSRRKALGGLATIGVAGAAAGYGTSALYTDEETFGNNSITAGTLNMEVTAEVVAANDEYENAVGTIDYVQTADQDTAVAGYSFEDFKPGDWVIICWDINVGDNPGYVCIHGGEFSQDGGETTEPEPTPDDGELADNLLLTHWNGVSVSSSDITSRDELIELSQTTNKNSLNPQSGSWSEPDEDGSVDSNRHYTDVLEFLFGEDQNPDNKGVPDESNGDLLGNGYASTDGVVIRNTDTANGGSEGGIGGPGTDVREVGSDDNGDNPDGVTFYQLIELPVEVGNEVQGDTLQFDLAFKTVQSRNVGTSYSDLQDNIRAYPFDNQVDGSNADNNIPSSSS